MNKPSIKQIAITAALGTALSTFATSTLASEFTLSEASGASVAAPIAIVGIGASAILATTGTVVVKSVQIAGNATRVVVESGAQAAAATLTFVGNSAKAFAGGAGDTLRVVPMASGVLLYEAQRVIAWVPDPGNANLTHNERLTQ